ncbi:MAG: DNA recombination protein RmuC [Pseudomonadota bacterium]
MTVPFPDITFPAAARAAGVLLGWLIAGLRIRSLRRRISDHGAQQMAAADHLQESWDALEKQSTELLNQSRRAASAEARLEHMAELKAALSSSRQDADSLRRRIHDLEKTQAVVETIAEKEQAAAAEKLALLKDIQARLPDTFRSVSTQTMKENNQAFIDLATATLEKYLSSAITDLDKRQSSIGDTVKPIHEALQRYDRHVRDMEMARENAYGSLSQHLNSVSEGQLALQRETGKLVKALREPTVRGRWGELTLKRVVEISGMTERCDFVQQQTATTEAGVLRPDMIVLLPGGRQVVVDAKVPLTAYLNALEAEDPETRENWMADHARQVAVHIQQLSVKTYWRQFQPTPEFVVLFIPGENFFSAALSIAPHLIETAAARGIVLATPTTLISLLKTVALTWRESDLTDNARAISEMGAELYQRLSGMTRHLVTLGKEIDRTTGAYNRLVGSYERRVMPSARKFEALGVGTASGDPLPDIGATETRPRIPAAEGARDDGV